MVRGIKFVGIPVRDQDVSLKFYTETLGLKVVTDQPFTDTQGWIELLIPGAETGSGSAFGRIAAGVGAMQAGNSCPRPSFTASTSLFG